MHAATMVRAVVSALAGPPATEHPTPGVAATSFPARRATERTLIVTPAVDSSAVGGSTSESTWLRRRLASDRRSPRPRGELVESPQSAPEKPSSHQQRPVPPTPSE